jgi:hypothetical protein
LLQQQLRLLLLLLLVVVVVVLLLLLLLPQPQFWPLPQPLKCTRHSQSRSLVH